MKKLALLLIACVCFAFLTATSKACDKHGETGIAPANRYWIGPDFMAYAKMDEAGFNAVIDKVESVYAPIIASMGAQLQVERRWLDGTVNAYAQQTGKVWSVHMFGGLARHGEATQDAFALVICHEIGHHIGGAPKYAGAGEWASNEGQADYFGATKCLKRVWANDDNISIVKNGEKIDPIVRKRCSAVYGTNNNESAMCERVSLAGLHLARLLGALSGTGANYGTPDQSKVSRTYDAHPKSQCRLDSYFAGAVCNKPADSEVSPTDPSVGYCTPKDGSRDGFRPQCWYAPSQADFFFY